MTPERWQQIKSLVNSALEQNTENRSAVLRQSCADDLPLRRGAEALLSFHEQATRNLAGAPAQLNSHTTLSPEQWERIEQLFHSSMGLDPAKRAAFLDEACGGDEQVRREVEALLVFQTGVSGLIQGAVEQAAGLLAQGQPEKPRFAPGTVLAGRYRIAGLLGKGGMGEVYRADDLKLGQPVALKFLTEKLSKDKAMLARFHGEVRVARQVTHPNVCRVHDIGEVATKAGSQHFLSMEYVDGEDLSSLLRRIGRLPADKAVEISNQLCAGLAAAHDAGVLHRDLKPANVMLDGKGRVRITDFGLAGLAEQISGEEVFAGTPAYMSPEQFAGKEVTTKSDIYALGLVLYEIFTGKRVFEAGSLDELRRLHESSSPTNPSSWVKDIDPLVERVILRCLEKDPSRRLASAKQVADALPGGDPLAAALALGETPSPEMVAAAGSKEGMKPKYAVACLLAILGCLIALPFLNRKVKLVERMPLDNSPEVLGRKAREITAQLGWPESPVDTAYGIMNNGAALQHYARAAKSIDDWDKLVKEERAPFLFWYRESPIYFLPEKYLFSSLSVTPDDPEMRVAGMTYLTLNFFGKLESFEAVPDMFDAPSAEPAVPLTEPDWKMAFIAAGLDFSKFTTMTQIRAPRTAYDVRRAWMGPHPLQPAVRLHIEMAAYRGRLVYFYRTESDRIESLREQQKHRFQPSTGEKVSGFVLSCIMFLVLVSAAWLTRRNLRLNKGDRRGAFRLAAFVFLGSVIHQILQASHAPVSEEYELFLQILARSLFFGGLSLLFYLALEPYVRRRWPDTLIGLQRLLAGGWRDPLVGRDLLIGLAFGFGVNTLTVFGDFLDFKFGGPMQLPISFISMLSLRNAVGLVVADVTGWIYATAGTFFFIFMTCVLVRREWLAVGLLNLVLISLAALQANRPWFLAVPILAIWGTSIFLVARRYGLLALYSFFFGAIIYNIPLTANISAWYAGNAYFVAAIVLGLAFYAFHTALGGQKVFAGKLLEE